MTIENVAPYGGYRLNAYQPNGRKEVLQPFKPRPYDEQEYYWAISEDTDDINWDDALAVDYCRAWKIFYKGNIHTAMLGNFKDIVDELNDLNRDIKPNMCYD